MEGAACAVLSRAKNVSEGDFSTVGAPRRLSSLKMQKDTDFHCCGVNSQKKNSLDFYVIHTDTQSFIYKNAKEG